MSFKINLLIIPFLLILVSAKTQDLSEVRQNIIGNWDLDMEQTWDVYNYTKEHMSGKQIREFEEFLTMFEVYKWIIREDGSISISFQSNGRNFPSQNSTYEIEEVELSKNELKLIGKNPVFNPWAENNKGIKITANKQSKYILSCGPKKMIIYDIGSPLVFNRIE